LLVSLNAFSMRRVESSVVQFVILGYETNMTFAGVNIYGRTNIWCEDQVGWPPRILSNLLELKRNRQFYMLLAWRNHNPYSGAPYDKLKQLWNNFCIKVICQSHYIHYHFSTTSDKIYMTNKYDK
jgi:hypothetical protein